MGKARKQSMLVKNKKEVSIESHKKDYPGG